MNIHLEKIIDELYILRIDDRDTRYFEALWEIPEGITYNAYLLVTGEGTVLFDTWKHVYSEIFVETIKKVIDPRDLKYIVIHHMEQDHSGALPRILRENDFKATILGHPLVANMMSSFYGIKALFRPVRDDEKISVGEYKLRIIHTPWLHWPETIMSYIEELEVLLSCDGFGSYSIPSKIFDNELNSDEMQEYLEYSKKYLITVVGYYKDYIIKNIEKIKEKNINLKIIAPSHGLVWRSNPSLIIEKYIEWAKGTIDNKKAVIIYASMYGEVEEAVNYLAEKLVQKGWSIRRHSFTDKSRAKIGEILSDIVDTKLLVIGVSTYESGIFPLMKQVLDLIVEKTKYDKQVIIIASYGWGPIAGKKVTQLLMNAGFKVLDTIEFRGRMNKEIIEKIEKLINTL